MLFNTLDFALFLPIVFVLYWFVLYKNLQLQNTLIVAASLIFYGWWDWRFLSLLVFSSLTDYCVGLGLLNEKNETKRKTLLSISILVNLSILGFFKYYNFFVYNFISAFTWLGNPIHINTLDIILPVGISFYTFQALSYSIDVYRRKLEPTRNVISYLAFISFFPQLVAGPIERATHLLPQFYVKRNFDFIKAVDGLKQMLWGLFKKVVIADNCAQLANTIFDNSSHYSGSTLVAGAFFFAFQIYGDFSGYSDMAIGMARLFGFDLMRNFAFPYFSQDIAQFWRRWNISLSTWFRDYVYIPLGGNNGGPWMTARNIAIIFLVSGFWHGANWTFIIWGALHAVYYLSLMLMNKNRINLDVAAHGKYLPSTKEFINILKTFSLVAFAWIFFRAENVGHAFHYINGIFSSTLFAIPEVAPLPIVILIFVFISIEWLGREEQYALSQLGMSWPQPIRYCLYFIILASIFVFAGSSQPFIYFQF